MISLYGNKMSSLNRIVIFILFLKSYILKIFDYVVLLS